MFYNNNNKKGTLFGASNTKIPEEKRKTAQNQFGPENLKSSSSAAKLEKCKISVCKTEKAAWVWIQPLSPTWGHVSPQRQSKDSRRCTNLKCQNNKKRPSFQCVNPNAHMAPPEKGEYKYSLFKFFLLSHKKKAAEGTNHDRTDKHKCLEGQKEELVLCQFGASNTIFGPINLPEALWQLLLVQHSMMSTGIWRKV